VTTRLLPEVPCRVTERVSRCLEQVDLARRAHRLPSTTLAYAQSLDGSIADRPGAALQISNAQSLAMTHRLRARHDAVLVGINTVLADDPRLTVRLVPGKNPRPVVLDGALRFPPHARLLRDPCVPPLIFTGSLACPRAESHLRAAGATVVRVPAGPDRRLDLAAVLQRLAELGIASLMVEGGARVITSFLRRGLVDQVVLTISPQFVGGLRGLRQTPKWPLRSAPRLRDVFYDSVEGDLVIFGSLRETPAEVWPAVERPGGVA
jgi:GTP cyclohydrolase II